MTNAREHARAPGRASTDHDDDHHHVTPGKRTLTERDDNGVAAGADHAVAATSASSGHALPGALQHKFESSLGADLSSVRIHTGEASAHAAHAAGARAYTLGQDIHFGAGHYDPSSAAGEHLLAHEVAHTVQQRGGTPTRQFKLAVSGPGDSAEHEADRAADAMVAGGSARVASASGGVQRDFDPKTKKAATDTSGDGAGTVTTPPWEPHVAVGAAPPTVKLNATMKTSGSITNAAQAPSGTSMRLGFWRLGNPGLEALPDPAPGPTGSLGVKVISLASPSHQPMAGALYTVPGQAERTKDAPAPSAFTVAQPSATWTMEHVDGKAEDTLEIGKSKRAADQLVLGDTVKLHAKIDNVERPQEVVAPVLEGAGVKAAPAPEWNGNTVTYSYALTQAATNAKHEATTAKMQLKLPAGGEPRVLEHEFQYRIAVSKQRFVNMCSQAIGKIVEAQQHFGAYLSALTLAYADAYNTHTARLEAIGKAAAARDAFTVGLVMSFIPGGVGGLVGDTMKKITSDGMIVDSVKEMSKFAPKLATSVASQSHFAAVPDTDPLHMEHQANKRGMAELAEATKQVNGWLKAANDSDPSLSLDFDPYEVTVSSLKIAGGQNLTAAIPFDAAGTTRKFQQGFFCTWVDKRAAQSFMSSSQFSWGKAEPQISAYGTSIGVADAKERVSKAVTKGVVEHNEQARKGPRAGGWL